MALTMEHRRHQDLAVAVLAGQIDVATSAQLREDLTCLVASGTRHLILDVSAVSLIDSNGLGVLLALHHHLRDHCGSVALTGVNRQIREVLRVTRLITVFPIYGTADVAIHAHHAGHHATAPSHTTHDHDLDGR
ncbi:STAS domain-containing protein [Actinomadura soli]|nr:STAS domain-containing protein [Actinomadura soli]